MHGTAISAPTRRAATQSGRDPASDSPSSAYPRFACSDPALPELEFYGCHTRPMTPAEYEAYEGRIEFFDSGLGFACIANEAAHLPHERPLHMLGSLLERIVQVRGSPIALCGAVEIRRVLPDGQTIRIQPDQTVYLDPGALDRVGPRYLTAAGEEPRPDVVVEVDSTTDVRGSRLAMYEAWGYPEVWVEVPQAYAPGRRRGMRSELRIYLPEGARYALAEESRAFPTWRAAEIHRALNDPVISEETSAVLTRVGLALGDREGTGPEDDPLLRQQRAEARAVGRVADVAVLLASRGIAVPTQFPSEAERDLIARVPFAAILAAADAAGSLGDFFARLEAPDA